MECDASLCIIDKSKSEYVCSAARTSCGPARLLAPAVYPILSKSTFCQNSKRFRPDFAQIIDSSFIISPNLKGIFLRIPSATFWNSEKQRKNGKVPFLSLAKLKTVWIIYSSPPQCGGCRSGLTGKYAYPQKRLI